MKSKWEVKLVMGAETCASMEGFDTTYSVVKDLEASLNRILCLYIYTDSNKLLGAIKRGRRKSMRTIIIDTQAARRMYKCFEIFEVTFTHGADRPADGLSKTSGNEKLGYVMRNAIDKKPFVQCIKRESRQSTISW